MMSVILIGSIMVMSGCGASNESTENITQEQTVQDENSASVTAGISEETQSTKTEIQSEYETETDVEKETETETEAETETETEAEIETQSEDQTETKTETVIKPEEQSSAVQDAASISESDYAVIVKGVKIPLNGDMRDYTALLGEPDEFGSARSCTEAGDDKVYTYGGTVIYTYITNGADIISLIEIEGSESLTSGIHIGSTKAEVIAAYGSSYKEDGSELLYELGNKTLGIQMNGETVSFIELFG